MARSSSSLEHLMFTVGDDFGHGTCGLGPDAARAASAQLHRALLEQYWKDKDRVHMEWKQQEQQAKAKRLAESKRSPRQRLEEALIEREMAIKKQVEQRKAEERALRESREREAVERAKEFREGKKAAEALRIELLQHREEEKRYELERIHAEKARLAEVITEESTNEVSQQRDRARRVRQWQEVSKARARDEAEQRILQNRDSALEMNQRQGKLENQAKSTRKAIEALKKDAAKALRTHEKSEHYRPLQEHITALSDTAASIRRDVKEKLETLQRNQKNQMDERKQQAQQRREEAAESKRLYEEERKRQQELMQRSVKLQREEARRVAQEEAERKRQEHQEYIQTLRSLMQRTKSPPNGATTVAAAPPPSHFKPRRGGDGAAADAPFH